MRIVMVTDDATAIDRRILLEADTLLDDGHEVILLARQVETVPPSERIGRIKVERLQLGAATTAPSYWRQALLLVLPGWARALAVRAYRTLRFGLGIIRFGRSYIRGMLAYLEWNARQRRHMLATATLTPNARLRMRLAGVVRSIQRRALQAVAGVGYVASLPFRSRERKPLGKAMAVTIWDRAIQDRIVYYDPDIIHVHDLPQLYGGVLAKRDLKVPLIYDTHENYSEIGTLTPSEQAYLRERETNLLHECDAIITVNRSHAVVMKEQYPPHTFDVIQNATLPPAGFTRGPHDDRIRRKLGLSSDVRILMYQGWFSEHGRGLLELIEAMAKVRSEVHLVMMGYGDFDRFEGFVRAAGCTGRIHLMQPVPWQELIHWSASADAGIIPYQEVDKNHSTASPNKLFEFIVAGLPILANDLVFLRYAIAEQGFGMVRRMTTAEEMTTAINELFDPASDVISKARAQLLAKASSWEWTEEQKVLRRIYARFPVARVRSVERVTRTEAIKSLQDLVPDYADQLAALMAKARPRP